MPALITAIATLLVALTGLAALFVQQQQELDETSKALDVATSQPTPTVTVTVTETATLDPETADSPGSAAAGTAFGTDGPTAGEYLSDLEPVDTEGADIGGTVSINGQPYGESLQFYTASNGTTSWIEFNLGRAYESLSVTLGVDDNAAQDPDDPHVCQWRIVGDDEELLAPTTTSRSAPGGPFTVDVRDVLHMRLEVIRVSGDGSTSPCVAGTPLLR